MITVEASEKLILENLIDLPDETISIQNCFGRVLKQNIVAERDQPPFNRAAMDGIGLIRCEQNTPSEVGCKICDIQKAGEAPKEIEPGCCIEVMTGAALSPKIDCVIPYEKISIENKQALYSKESLKKNQNIHMQGSDYKESDILLEKGVVLGDQHISVLASNGYSKLLVKANPKVALISTGDELVEIEEKILPHQIRRSNTYALFTQLKGIGINDINLFHIKDELEKMYSEIEKILNEHDIIILTGGVSKGKFDFVPKVLKELGVTQVFHKIKQRPGKPLWFGTQNNKKLVFGLPGNPVSSFITNRKYVIPTIRKILKMENNSDFHQDQIRLGENFEFKKELTYFLPIKLSRNSTGDPCGIPVITNGSGDFNTLTQSDGFIVLDEQETLFKKDNFYPYYPWGQM